MHQVSGVAVYRSSAASAGNTSLFTERRFSDVPLASPDVDRDDLSSVGSEAGPSSPKLAPAPFTFGTIADERP
jgi:hypothetical protein